MCVDKNVANNEDTVKTIKNKGGTAYIYECDIIKKDNVNTMSAQVKKDIGFVSMLFYCCGIPSPRSLMTEPPQDIHETLDLTLTSYFWVFVLSFFIKNCFNLLIQNRYCKTSNKLLRCI